MAIIVDIDDTLLRNGTQPIQRTIDYIKTLDGPIYIVTGRSPSQKAETVSALHAAGVRFSRIYMNPGPLSDNEYKGEIGKKLKAKGATVAIENNPDARAQYRKAGLKTLDPANLPNMKKFWILRNR
jgi:hydroxymethylpyrimidine pyrophosphatase-like HAD family hydrolase